MAGGRNEAIFRKVALDRLASPEQLDLLMEVTNPRSWIALIALAILLATAVVWGFAGSIPTQVEGQGVLIKSGGVFEIFSQGAGPVKEVLIKENDVVKEGQVVARIEQPELETRIANAKAAFDEQKREHDRRRVQQARPSLLEDSNQLQKASLDDTIRFSESRLKSLQERLQNERTAARKERSRAQVLFHARGDLTTRTSSERRAHR